MEDDRKKRVGTAAADRVDEDVRVFGAGTGSTAMWAIRRLGERRAAGELSELRAVATSSQAVWECRAAGIPLVDLSDVAEQFGAIDLVIDGADEFDADRNLVKGGGGALLREKVVARLARRIITVVGGMGKFASRLGVSFPIPCEVVPFARDVVVRTLREWGAEPEVRQAVRKQGDVVTDNGNLIVDVRFPPAGVDPAEMEARLNMVAGICENGLFVGMNPTILVVDEAGKVRDFGG